jgi:hypothetical protein
MTRGGGGSVRKFFPSVSRLPHQGTALAERPGAAPKKKSAPESAQSTGVEKT